MGTKIEGKILEASEELFARQGYGMTTTREVASRADVSEPSIFRVFANKEILFQRTVNEVTERAMSPAEFHMILSSARNAKEFPGLVVKGVRQWYFSISAQSARLLMQAMLTGNAKWSKMAYVPLNNAINVLVRNLEREMGLPQAKASVASRTLILALFQFKIGRALLGVSGKETVVVESMIRQWLPGISGTSD
ncbi:MAG TPA: helix-turn-helix domain-containing protein [Candidatus Angelobacter sp.]|nr:helix-turn-helix domain-containing protein [Candidatus Angelobacter sp.]